MENVQAALHEMREVVGASFIYSDPEEIDRRARVTIPHRRMPAAFVYPAHVDELQRLLGIANRYNIPLWPCSKGRNWGYGSATPYVEGSVVVVLERLNRILEVNEELAYAVLEPGVTYRQLNDHLKQQGSKLWCDCTDGPPEGSVLGNALERGIGATPYGDHFGNLCGLEVLLPDGSLVHTGGGPLEGFHTWHTHKWGVGPYLEGLFSQSNFGIVIKAGIWLMPEPEAFEAIMFDVHHSEHLPQVINALRVLALQGVIQTKIHLINDVVALALLTDYPTHLLQGQRFLSEEVLAQLRQRYAIAPWSFGIGLYGTQAQVRVARRIVRKALGQYGAFTSVSRSKIRLVQVLLPWLKKARTKNSMRQPVDFLTRRIFGKPFEVIEAAPHLYGILQGIPTEYFVRHAYFRSGRPKPAHDVHPARDGCGLTWFAPIVPFASTHMMRLLSAAKPLFQRQGFDFYVAFLLLNPRSIVPLMAILYRQDDAAETVRAQVLYDQLCESIASLGYQQYRSAVFHGDRLFEKAPEFWRLLNSLKSALDPNNILAPGRYGIGIDAATAAQREG